MTIQHDNCNQSSIETEVTAASRGQKFAHFYEAEISLAWLLICISSWVLCHLFWPLHEYRAVLLLKLQNYNRMTKIRPAKFWQKQFIDASISRDLYKCKSKNKLSGSPTNSSQKNKCCIYIYICVCVCVLLPSKHNQGVVMWLAGREDFRTNVNSLKHNLIVITNM